VLKDLKAALASGDLQKVQHLLLTEGSIMTGCDAREVAYEAMIEGHEGIAKQLLSLPSVTDDDREQFLQCAVENSSPGIVGYLLSTGTQVPTGILADVSDTQTLDMLLATVPEEEHDEVLLGRFEGNGMRLLLQQYKQQWEVRQEAEQLKAVAQQMLVGAVVTHKRAQAAAAEAAEETRAAAAAAAAASSRKRMRR
jgi:hypothetical protein